MKIKIEFVVEIDTDDEEQANDIVSDYDLPDDYVTDSFNTEILD